MTHEYKICLETFIRWEQLTGRSFQLMNYEDEGDLYKLLYCAYWVATGCEHSFEVFQKTVQQSPKFFNRAIKALTRYNTLASQFASMTPAVQIADSSEKESQTPPFMGDIAARLIVMGGMDARYVMREMTVEDMLMFVRALDDKQRQEAESQRLWTYLSMLPHVDGKKLNTPQKLLMFPWEMETRVKEVQQVTAELKAEFESFMRSNTPAPKTGE